VVERHVDLDGGVARGGRAIFAWTVSMEMAAFFSVEATENFGEQFFGFGCFTPAGTD